MFIYNNQLFHQNNQYSNIGILKKNRYNMWQA